MEDPEKGIVIEYWLWDEKLTEKIKDSTFRFDVVLVEGKKRKGLETSEINREIRDYYQDIEIIYISTDKHKFYVHSEELIPAWRMDQAMTCLEIFQFTVFLCQQVRYKRERLMLEKLHQLSLEINSKEELEEILSHTCKTAVDILGVDHSGFVLFEKDLSKGVVAEEYPELSGDKHTIIHVKGIEIEEKLVFKKEIINIQDLKENLSMSEEIKSILFQSNIRSILIVPVVLNEKVIASFSLDMIRKCRIFYEDEIDFCRKLAAHVALAIGNTRNLKEISVLNEIALAIEEQLVQVTDIKKIAESIRNKAGQLVDVKNFFMLGYNEKENRYEFLFHQDEIDDPEKITQEALRRSLSAYVVRHGAKLMKKRDIELLYQEDEAELVGNPAEVWLGVPLVTGHGVIGVMVVQNYYNENAYDEYDLKILSTIATQAAIAIDNYYLLQEQRNLLHDMRKQVTQTTALYGTFQEMIQESPDISKLLEKIVKEAVEIYNADAGQLFFYDETSGISKVMFTYNMELLQNMEFEPGGGMIDRLLKTGKGLYTNDYFNEDYASPKLNRPEFKEKVQGVVMVPLKWKGKIIGILAMSSKPGDQRIFSQEDVNLLEYFAGPAAIATGIARIISFQQALMHNSPEAIIAVDNKGKITEFNRSSERIIGCLKQDMLGKSVVNFYYDGIEEARKMKTILDKFDRIGEPVRDIHASVRGSKGEKIPILFSGAILKDVNGLSIGSIGLVRDFREITRIDEEYRKQQSLLAELETFTLDSSIKQREGLKEHITQLLERACESCRVRYMILFAGLTENDMVLQPIAWWGLPKEIIPELPHFNWRKANLLQVGRVDEVALRQETKIISGWIPDEGWRYLIIDGIKGRNREYFKDLSCGVPVRLADNYRSVLVFGPFTDKPSLLKMDKFLKNIAHTINFRAMSWLQAIYLEASRRESENALQLITHRARMYLQQIVGKFGMIKRKVEKDSPAFSEALEGERLSVQTATVIGRALTSLFAEMEQEDFCLQTYSLPALVQNCASSFEEKALKNKKRIVLDETIEYLPDADVDAHFLSTALGNLIENAIKYGFDDTNISILSRHDLKNVTIIVQNIGEKMDERAKENLLKPGKRWGMSARARRIPGTGLGLWDASVIAAAHGGEVNFSSIFYKIVHGKSAFQVKVWITIPIKQEKINKSND